MIARLEASHALVECFQDEGSAFTLTKACRLKARLWGAKAAFITELNTGTLADCTYPHE